MSEALVVFIIILGAIIAGLLLFGFLVGVYLGFMGAAGLL